MITCSTDKDDNILIMQIYDKEYRIAQLLAKEITGTLSLEEREELEIWRNENHSTQELYKQILDPQNRSQRDQFVKELNLEKSWKHVQQQIIPKYSHIKHSLTWISGIVASILIIIGVSLVLFNTPKSDQVSKIIAGIHSGSPKAIFITPEGKQIHLTPQDTIQTLKLENGLVAINRGNTFEYSGSDNQPLNINKFNTIQVPRGGEYELILPDSTHVWINSDSELSFPVHFNKENREVILSGEAYFAVAKKMKQPFIVKTKDEIEIKVLGTQFNVRAYPEARTIETTLNQGAVKISSKQQSVELKPNQQAVYTKTNKQINTRNVDASLYSAWKDGLFVFENQPLEDIMTTLARWYNINVFYSNPAVKDFHFTGDLERYSDFKQTLQMLEKATSIHFIINENNVTVEEIYQIKN